MYFYEKRRKEKNKWESIAATTFFLLCFMRRREMEKGQSIYLLIFVTFSHFLCVFAYLFFLGGRSVPRPFWKVAMLHICKCILCCSQQLLFWPSIYKRKALWSQDKRGKDEKYVCIPLPHVYSSHRCNMYCTTQTVCFLSKCKQKGSIGN